MRKVKCEMTLIGRSVAVKQHVCCVT